MILALDVGNTHIVIGCMEGREIKYISRIATNRLATESEYAIIISKLLEFGNMGECKFDGAIISSVVPPLTRTLSDTVKMLAGVEPVVVGAGIKTGINILIDDPATLGSDLLVAAAGALDIHEPPLILIDMGTATTITVIDKNGAIRGGAIIPGMRLSLSALSSHTSLLPSISLEAPKKVIGTNTIDCMKSGSVLGTAFMIDGMIDGIEKELGMKATVIATGGLAQYIIPICRNKILENEDLLLYGLAVIYEKNKKK